MAKHIEDNTSLEDMTSGESHIDVYLREFGISQSKELIDIFEERIYIGVGRS